MTAKELKRKQIAERWTITQEADTNSRPTHGNQVPIHRHTGDTLNKILNIANATNTIK